MSLGLSPPLGQFPGGRGRVGGFPEATGPVLVSHASVTICDYRGPHMPCVPALLLSSQVLESRPWISTTENALELRATPCRAAGFTVWGRGTGPTPLESVGSDTRLEKLENKALGF